MSEKVLITSALPYANGPLHFGHIAGAYLPGDCYARFQRLLKRDVLYICGSDEYGVAITLSAEMAGRTPQEHVDLYHHMIVDFFKKLHLSFDHYSRTTWVGHKETVHQYFLDLVANGYIEEKITDQLYSEKDQRFLADRYVIGICPGCGFEKARGDECPKCGASYEATDLKNPLSKLTLAPLTLKATKHWFFRLDTFKERLSSWLEEKQWKPNVINFVRQYIRDLRPRAITRDSDWGVKVPLPNTEGKVLYVWFDAPIGYISATKEWANKKGDSELWKHYWLDPKTKLVHFIGKDNIFFHAAIFPAMTMGQNQPYKIVDELPANEFYLLEGRQFSKSEGWYIDLEDFFSKYSADQIRYVIAANAPETADSEFLWKDFQMRCNAELLGKYGNFVNRVLVFAKRYFENRVPKIDKLEEIDRQFLDKIALLAEEAKKCYSTFKLRAASQVIMELAQEGNVYFDRKCPWKAIKDPDLQGKAEVAIACCLECVKVLALISYPIIPTTALSVWQMLGFKENLLELGWSNVLAMSLKPGVGLSEAKILFTKIEDVAIEEEIKKLETMQNKNNEQNADYEPVKSTVAFNDFEKLDFRVATIVAAESIKKSNKLLKLQVDLGFEKRTIVSGIKKHYDPETLIGKKVVIVANLQPVKMMGEESQGMVLCASRGEDLELICPQNLPAGSVVS